MVALGAEGLAAEVGRWTWDRPAILFVQSVRCFALSFAPCCWLLFTVSYARGNVRDFLRHWSFILAVFALLPVLVLVGLRWGMGTSGNGSSSAQIALSALSWPLWLVHLALVIATILALVNLEKTFTASVGLLRWRIKYLILGMACLLAVRLYTSSQTLLSAAPAPLLDHLNTAALLVACVLATITLQRSYGSGIELYPSKGTLYGSIAFLLAGIYLFTVGVLGKWASRFGGDQALPLKSFLILTALSTCAAFALSDRFRWRVRQLISRHFQRPVYDYRELWCAFTERTTSCQDPDTLSREIVRLISGTIEALSVTLWHYDAQESAWKLGASTSLPPDVMAHPVSPRWDSEWIEQTLGKVVRPFDLDSAPEVLGAELRRLNPNQFQTGGSRIVVPLISRNEVLGVIVVGDRVGGVGFTTEDLELLRCVGEQTATSLVQLRLSAQWMRAKEMEAFQQMAAFFVHDLKNTASSLSLLLQNLPSQFENPEFRTDALRVTSKAVGRVQDLIDRLTTLRQGLAIQKREVDLSEMVEAALSNLGAWEKPRLHKDLKPLPKISMDPEQMQKVVVNLVWNARESISGDGDIHIRTEAKDGGCSLWVQDSGCGMTSEFIQKSLFRPFQTTKRQGMGIGMFHCKTIVEAHRGRIEVASEVGKGTVFHVWIPCS